VEGIKKKKWDDEGGYEINYSPMDFNRPFPRI
jgi:hypothetical protein